MIRAKSITACLDVLNSSGSRLSPRILLDILLCPLGRNDISKLRFIICGSDIKIGMSPFSWTSTVVDTGGAVGNVITTHHFRMVESEFANDISVLQRFHSHVIPYFQTAYSNSITARIEPMERVHPMSSITYVGDIRISMGFNAFHAAIGSLSNES